MKKMILFVALLICSVLTLSAQETKGGAQIKFEKTTHNFGTFSENAPKVSCEFAFTNVGDAPLIINQAVAGCGCTSPQYPKEPIQPGQKGVIKVTYNGAGRFPGHFKKSITVRTNGTVEMTRLYIEGDMEEAK